MAIKGVLKEELENSIRMKEKYEKELVKLPEGSFKKKKIKFLKGALHGQESI